MQHLPLAFNSLPGDLNMYLDPCSHGHASCVADYVINLPSSTLNTSTTTWTQTFHGCLPFFLFLPLDHLWFVPTSLMASNTNFDHDYKIYKHMRPLFYNSIIYCEPHVYQIQHLIFTVIIVAQVFCDYSPLTIQVDLQLRASLCFCACIPFL